MPDKSTISSIAQASKMAAELNRLLHEDALHRMQLFKEYARERDALEWTPELYTRCQIAEALCEKLERLLAQIDPARGLNGSDAPAPGPVAVMPRRAAEGGR